MRIALVTVALSALALAEIRIQRLSPPAGRLEGELQTLPPEARRTLAFGYRAAVSDFAWLDAIQYYGDVSNADERFSRLAGMLDLVTDLDPHFDYAYQFGGEAIPYHEPNGEKLWYNTKRAIALLRKGASNNPRRWEIPWLLGYNLYTYWGDYREAGEAITQAADLADRGRRGDERFAPPTYLRSLALRLLAQGGAIETAIETTKLALVEAPDDQARAELNARLGALVLELQLQKLNDLAEKLTRSQGHAPATIQELTDESGDERANDPYGDPYFVDATGHVKSHNENQLLRLHIHPGEPAIERASD